MKKLMAILATAMLLLTACGGNEEQPTANEADKPKEEAKQEPKKKEEPKEEKPEEEKKAEPKKDEGIKVTDEFAFGNYTVAMKSVRVYEKKGKEYADIEFSWLNQAGEGEKTFMQVSAVDVEQGGTILEETTGAWDPLNKNSSQVYFPNAQNGEAGVGLTYALENKEDPITITFVPMTGEGSEKVTVDIK